MTSTPPLGHKIATATQLLSNKNDDGEPLMAAFVSFCSLQAANLAIQIGQSGQAHAMEAFEAPDQGDVLWDNVGKTHNQLQLGSFFSMDLTTLLCLCWTGIIAFAVSLSSLEGLCEIEFIDKMLHTSPWLEPVFAQLAPFIVVAVNAMLKYILEFFTTFKLPVSMSIFEASLFTKLAWFMIIQNFFVASISSASAASFTKDLIGDPTSIIQSLASALPAQSTFHIQILLVNVFISMSYELLGAYRLVIAWIQSAFGPGLTEKERTSSWMGLQQVNNPDPFIHSFYTAWNVRYFLALFVYSTIARISSVFMAMCFVIIGVSLRYLFIYIFPIVPDSRGKLFLSLLKIILVCMVIAELSILGLLGLKESAIAPTLTIPLLVGTIVLNIYVKQKHFVIAKHLPSGDCLAIGSERRRRRKFTEKDDDDDTTAKPLFDVAFLRDVYLHPDLKAKKKLLPDNLPPGATINAGGNRCQPGVAAKSRDEEESAPHDLLFLAPEACNLLLLSMSCHSSPSLSC